jgi:hypothetical protein
VNILEKNLGASNDILNLHRGSSKRPELKRKCALSPKKRCYSNT